MLGLTSRVCCAVGVTAAVGGGAVADVVLADGETVGSAGGETTKGIDRTG